MSHFHKEITLSQAIALLLTTLLGTGAFVIPALTATIAGEHALWAWIIMLLIMLPIGIVFGLLGAAHPHPGGTAYLLGKAFGHRWRNAASWLYLALIPIGLPAAMTICVSYLSQLLGLDTSYESQLAIGCLFILLTINLLGIKTASVVQTLIAISVTACLAWLLVRSDLESSTLAPPAFSFSQLPDIGSAMAVIFWCFMGIEAMTHMGAEFKKPQRDFPAAIVLSLLLTAVFYYLTVGLVLQYQGYGNEHTDSRSLTIIGETILGYTGAKFIAAMGFLASFASMSLYLMSFSRLIWSMADEKQIPKVFTAMNRHGAPHIALLTIGGVSVAALIIKYGFSLSLDALISYADGVFVTIYLLGVASGMLLLSKGQKSLAALSTLFCIAMVIAISHYMIYAAGVILLSMIWDSVRKQHYPVQSGY